MPYTIGEMPKGTIDEQAHRLLQLSAEFAGNEHILRQAFTNYLYHAGEEGKRIGKLDERTRIMRKLAQFGTEIDTASTRLIEGINRE